MQSLSQDPHRAQGHVQAGTTPRAGPHPWPGSFGRLGDIWGCYQVQPAKAQRMKSSKTEPHICCPLCLPGTRPAAVTFRAVMALKQSALTQGSLGTRYFPSDAQGLWVQAHIPAVTRSRATISTGDQWAQPASTWSHPVPCHCSHGQCTGVSSCWQAPRRVHSTGGVAMGTSCNSAFSCSKGLLLPRLELGREWHRTGHKSALMVMSGGFGGEMPPCSPAQSATAAVA